jgi:hypothetical protein
MQRGWESEIGGSRPGIEMFGGDYSSRPRPCMGCSAWVDGWMECPFVTFRPLKMRPVHCLETSGTDYRGDAASFQKNGVHTVAKT